MGPAYHQEVFDPWLRQAPLVFFFEGRQGHFCITSIMVGVRRLYSKRDIISAPTVEVPQMYRLIAGGFLAALIALGPGCDEEEAAAPGDGGVDLAAAEAGVDSAPGDGMDLGLDGEAGAADQRVDGEAGAADGGAPSTVFTMVVLPDTQYYAAFPGNYKHFTGQVNWIKANITARSLAFVSHVGDIVDSGALLVNQWKAADKAFKVLDGDLKTQPDGLIPYGAVPGNHDYDIVYLKGTPTQYIKYFGPDRYKGRSWFLGASPNKSSMAQRFLGGGKAYLHLAMEWRPSDESIQWAQEVMAKYPDLPTIITTHEHLGTGDPAKYQGGGKTDNAGGDNDAKNVFRKLVEPYPQVFLVVCGHVNGDGRRTDTTALGQQVYQVLVDYQSDPYGGNGWMQLASMDPVAKEIKFTAFSATYKPGSTPGTDHSKKSSSNHKASFDLDGHRAQLLARTVLHFRNGMTTPAGTKYAGTEDTHLGSGKGAGQVKPDKSHADAKNIHVDGNSDQEQGLLRFDSIIGAGKGQIPPKTKIIKAILTLTTEGLLSESGDGGKLYRMKVGWKESATWNGIGAPLVAGKATEATADLDTKGKVSSKGTRSFDVTTAVQAWADGALNSGWAILANGTNRWSFRSSEWGTVAERPMLTVVY